MKIIKKLLVLFMCLPLILLAFVSCGSDAEGQLAEGQSEIDYTKIWFPNEKYYDGGGVLPIVPDDESTYNEYYDSFIAEAKVEKNKSGMDYIWLVVHLKDTRPEGIESDEEYWDVTHSGVQIRLKVRFEDLDREAFAELTLDDSIEKIVFEYPSYDGEISNTPVIK